MEKKKNRFIYVIINFFIAVISVVLVIIPLTGALIMHFNSPASSVIIADENDGIRVRDGNTVYIDVRRGETSQSVGMRLERAKIIRTRYFWNLIARYEKDFIKSGTYKLEMPLSQIAIYKLLVSGVQNLQKVTIPEGVTIKRIARLLETEGICSYDDFLDAAQDRDILDEYNIPTRSMEGYLFPDTYFLPFGYPANLVIKMMADNFYKRIESIDPDAVNLTPRELSEKVIIASIVEREYRIPEEAALMASVFYNRLNINMGLQSCATVEYIITEIHERPHPGFITGADLEIDSWYNTYKWAGLPPGPISSPGALALRASFFPEKTDYFYFRLEDADTGRHIFSRSNEEHIQAGRLITKPLTPN